MGKIRVRVSQGGGFSEPVIVSLNPGSAQVPPNINCLLAIGNEQPVSPLGSGSPNSTGGVDLSFVINGNAAERPYALSDFQNFNIVDVDGVTGVVIRN